MELYRFSMKVTNMRLISAAFLVSFCATCAFAAQTPASPAPEQAVRTPSATMQPALDRIQQALNGLRPDKWKASGPVREEAAANISSIRQDLETTLPPLLAAADEAPGSVARVLPAFRNIEALYDVLLRVAEVGNIAAPREQNAALEQARASLEDGRRALGDRLQAAALAQEKDIRNLQAAVHAAPPAPAAAVCPPPPPAKKKRTTRRRSAKKPAPAAAVQPQGAAASH